jgi:hypothetical protein
VGTTTLEGFVATVLVFAAANEQFVVKDEKLGHSARSLFDSKEMMFPGSSSALVAAMELEGNVARTMDVDCHAQVVTLAPRKENNRLQVHVSDARPALSVDESNDMLTNNPELLNTALDSFGEGSRASDVITSKVVYREEAFTAANSPAAVPLISK